MRHCVGIILSLAAAFVIWCSPAAQISGFRHCIFEAVPLEGAWEMSYSSNAWTAAECPVFSGRVVSGAVPGCWDEMGGSFRAAGITDDFADNPHFLRQSLPLAGGARDTTIPGILGCFMYRRTVELRPDVVRLADSEPIDAGDSRCVIAFDCVRNNVRVWINGKFVGRHEGFSTPFEIAVPHGILKEGSLPILQ